jgi:hypothetical protein
VAEISRTDRARLAWLLAQVVDHGGPQYLTASEHKDLLHLLQISGLIPDTPLESGVAEPISGRAAQRQLVELRAGNPPMSGKAALLELYRIRGYWYLTPRQAALQRMKERWR